MYNYDGWKIPDMNEFKDALDKHIQNGGHGWVYYPEIKNDDGAAHPIPDATIDCINEVMTAVLKDNQNVDGNDPTVKKAIFDAILYMAAKIEIDANYSSDFAGCNWMVDDIRSESNDVLV